MTFRKLLIANRGEIAIRIARAAAELGIASVAVYAADDAASLHVRRADEAVPLAGCGAAAYLDIIGVVTAATRAGADAVHPGYGFLSENAEFARACSAAGLTFIGPAPSTLDLFGDKVAARRCAERAGIPVLPGHDRPASLEEAHRFFNQEGAVMIKAVAGGGGRGMRAVRRAEDLDEAYARCRSEAQAAFGRGDVYVERLLGAARHVEVQVLGDGRGNVSHLFERDCTLQRRHQKLVEMAPSPSLSPELRAHILEAAVALAKAADYASLGTIEFLVDTERPGAFYFLEVNPRLQVEHTVTEEVLGIDLVCAQIEVAAGRTLAELGLTQERIPAPRGHAIQLRINMETLNANGEVLPSDGTLARFDLPSGPGVRVDTLGYTGYRTSAAYDSLLAKLIVHTPIPNFSSALAKAERALAEFRVAGVASNIPFLRALLEDPTVRAGVVTTSFVEAHAARLVDAATRITEETGALEVPAPSAGPAVPEAPAGQVALVTLMQGTIVTLNVAEGDTVRPRQLLAVVEAMKMEHLVTADAGGIVRRVLVARGDTVSAGQPIAFVEPTELAEAEAVKETAVDPDAIRPDLAEVHARHALGLDEHRPQAVERRRKTGQRTARENVAELCDPGSFIEYGALAVAARRRRHSIEELGALSPADGLVAGIGTVNGASFGPDAGRTMVMAYDYTVFAGTQGQNNHKKQDRLLELAEQWRLPLVLFAEGGGGRPGDTDRVGISGLDVPTFARYARLSGSVPLVGIVSGRCFAGNAALLGCSDVIIATRNANIGMGGPAMIEGGGLGVYKPEEVGPVSVQAPNGVIDVLVEDEQEAVAITKTYLSYFQGTLTEWSAPDQRALRGAIPENRLRVYDIRAVIEGLCDTASVLELRRDFGGGIVTALVRIEGRPFGLLANNPKHLGGAIDANAADKAARFIQLCNAHGLPVISLCDTPGFMVGPEAEKTALVRHVCRLFVTSASISVPYFTVVLRKGYGLGAQAMAGGGFHQSTFTIAWPTGEFGAMGFEGAVRLGFRKELEAIADPAQREALFRDKVAALYAEGKALNVATVLEIDAVIDPAETRRWILSGLKATGRFNQGHGRKRGFVDAW